VIVVSHDALNEVDAWRSIVVVPVVTSERAAQRGLTVVPLAAGENGLVEMALALCHRVTTLERAGFVERCGVLSAETQARIREGLTLALDLGS